MSLAGPFVYIYFISENHQQRLVTDSNPLLPLFSFDGGMVSAGASFSCSLSSSMRLRFLSFSGFREGSSIAGYGQFTLFALI